MKYFSVPSDFKIETIDKYYELNNSFEDSQVIETYGQLTSAGIVNSGRVTDVLPEVDAESLESYVAYSNKKGIVFNYTLNPACFGNIEFTEEGIEKIFNLLVLLKSIGIDSLTITSPQMMEMVKATGLDFAIKSSAICEVTSPTKALFYKKLGVQRVVVDPDITRDFQKLRNISNVFGSGVEIIINNVCYKNCAYKMFHYNHEAHCTKDNLSQQVRNYFFNRCSMQKADRFENSIKLNWIRPEDLKYYINSGIHYFKLQGRQNVIYGDTVKTLIHYFNESFDGNLFDLITLFAPYNSFQPFIDNKKLDGFVKTFYDNPSFCSDTCDSCKYCESYAKKSMDFDSTENLNREASNFYNAYDDYTLFVNKHTLKANSRELFDEKDLNFEYDF